MANTTYTLVLLRHGQSDWNEKNLFTGWVDVPLTQKGRDEAARGGELLPRLCGALVAHRAVAPRLEVGHAHPAQRHHNGERGGEEAPVEAAAEHAPQPPLREQQERQRREQASEVEDPLDRNPAPAVDEETGTQARRSR